MDSTKKRSFNSPTKTTTFNTRARRNTTESLTPPSSPTAKLKTSPSTSHRSHGLRNSTVLNAVSQIKPIDYTPQFESINKRLDDLEAKMDTIISLHSNSNANTKINKTIKPLLTKRSSLQPKPASSNVASSVMKTSTTPDADKAVLPRQATIKPKKAPSFKKQKETIKEVKSDTKSAKKEDKPLLATKSTTTTTTTKAIKQKEKETLIPAKKRPSVSAKTSVSTKKRLSNTTTTQPKPTENKSQVKEKVTDKDKEKEKEIKESEERKSRILSFKEKLKNLKGVETTTTKTTISKPTLSKDSKDIKETKDTKEVKSKSISEDLDKKLSVSKPTDKKKEKKPKKGNAMKGKFSAFAAELDGNLSGSASMPQGSFKGCETLNISMDNSRELNNSLEHKSLERPMMKRGNKKTGNGEVTFISRKRI